MENCDPKILQAYRDGELSLEQKMIFEEHLSHCTECQKKLRSWRQIKAGIFDFISEAQIYGEKLPIWDAIEKEIIVPEMKPAGFSLKKLRPNWNWAAWGALAAASVVAGMILFSPTKKLPGNYCEINSASAPGHNLMIYQQPEDGFTVIWLQE